jgi:hypothetical protein
MKHGVKMSLKINKQMEGGDYMTPETIKRLCKAVAVLAVVVGGFGSILCLPYALGTDIRWISAAGIYFVAGAIMITGGLLSYTVLLKTE